MEESEETGEGISVLLAIVVEPSSSLSSSGMVIITILPPDIFAKVREIDELLWLCRTGKKV